MSYILDAVLLSSQQANPNEPPRLELLLASPPSLEEERRRLVRPKWLTTGLATGAACAIGIAGLAWIHAGLVSPASTGTGDLPVAAVPPAAVEKVPAPGPVMPAKVAAVPAAVPELVAARVSLAAAPPPVAESPPAMEKPKLVVIEKAPAAAEKPKVVIIEKPKPVVPEKPKAVAEKPKPAPTLARNQPEAGRLYRVPDLPADLQDQARQVSVSGFAISDKGQDRMAIINDRALREGDLVDANIKVESISADSVVFNLKGYRFRKGRS